VLSGGVLSTVFIPDTEEVTGSIPVSPTSTKRPLTCGYASQGPSLSRTRAGYVQDDCRLKPDQGGQVPVTSGVL
jgi:hypothetical protein